MMTGDTRVNNHRSTKDLLTELRRRTPLMQDKAVQSEYDFNSMDDSMAGAFDNHVANDIAAAHNDIVTTGNDVVTSGNDIVSSVTVAEINSPTSDDTQRNVPASPIYSRPLQRTTTDSEDSGLVDEGLLCPDGVDSATLELRPKHFIGSQKLENDAVDEIKEQMPPAIGNNCLYKEQKLKEQFETKDDTNNCALDCLAFTLECCQCVIL